MESNAICKKHDKTKESICGVCKTSEPMCTICVFEHILASHGMSLIPLADVVDKKLTDFKNSYVNDSKTLDEAVYKVSNMIKDVNSENEKCKTNIDALFKEIISMQNNLSKQYNQIITSLLTHLSKILREKYILNDIVCRRETEIKEFISDKKFFEANELLEKAIKNKINIDKTELENCIKNDTMKAKDYNYEKLELSLPYASNEKLKIIKKERDLLKKERDEYRIEIENAANILEAERLKFKNELNDKMNECIFCEIFIRYTIKIKKYGN